MTHAFVTCHFHMWHDSFIHSYVRWRMRLYHGVIICDITYSYIHVWHEFIGESCVFIGGSCSYVTWRMRLYHGVSICDITYLYVHMWHDSCSFNILYSPVTLHIHTFIGKMTHSHSHIWHDSFIYSYGTWFIHWWPAVFVGDMTHPYIHE